jgi:hypothetical protein
MSEFLRCQGRTVKETDLVWIRNLIEAHPRWSLHRVTKELCTDWNWESSAGVLKTFAARSFLLKLQDRGLLTLPAIRVNNRRIKRPFASVEDLALPNAAPVRCSLKDLQPLQVTPVEPGSDQDAFFLAHLVSHHYLGLRSIVGENLRYLVCDDSGTPIACLLFGSSAWKCAARDQFIGWQTPQRELNLHLTTNNCRFLIFPWVVVAHLASHALALAGRRLSDDWQERYGHPIHLVETFVDRSRFAGTCYRAANWICVGQTKGRTRQDRHRKISVPIKDVFVNGRSARWRQHLLQSG